MRKTSDEYDQIAGALLSSLGNDVMHPFWVYFVANWANCRERWCTAFRDCTVNFGNTTNNRLESSWKTLKAFMLNGKSTMLVCLETVEKYMCLLENEFTVRSLRLQYTSRSAAPAVHPALHDVCDDLSYHVIEQLETQRGIAEKRLASSSYNAVDVGDGITQIFSTQSRSTYTVNSTLATCSCRFFTIFHLPCCHHFFLSMIFDDPTIVKEAIADRFLSKIAYGTVIGMPCSAGHKLVLISIAGRSVARSSRAGCYAAPTCQHNSVAGAACAFCIRSCAQW
jgi:SWIM zinc finger